MKPYEYIALLSAAVWLIVPFVHYKSKHFIFFLFLGFSDLIASILWFGFHLSSQTFWIPTFYLIVLSVDRAFFFNKIKEIILGFAVVLILNHFSTTYVQ